MTTATLEPVNRTAAGPSNRRGQLALLLQEAFTVAVRMRANRQVATDAAAFRAHIKHLLGLADGEARRLGYDAEYVRLAIYAYVAFLDEMVLNSNRPMFADWPRQPLQEEVFGDHVAGENFFRHLNQLMGQQDSEDLADLLEVFQLCMLLGFRGKYGTAEHGGLQGTITAVQQKIARARGARGPLSPSWQLPGNETVSLEEDPWIRRLGILAVSMLALAIVLYVVYRIGLSSGLDEIRTIASQLTR